MLNKWILIAICCLSYSTIVMSKEAEQTISIDDYQDFKKTLQQGQKEIEQSEKLLHHHDIHTLIPEVFDNESNKSVVDQEDKKEVDKNLQEAVSEQIEQTIESEIPKENEETIKTDGQKIANTHANQPKTSDKRHSKTSNHSDWLKGKDRIELKPRVSYPQANAVKYGIKIGAQIRVKLVGGATNVQLGFVRFELLETVTGEEDVLPVNTLIFGKPFANNGSDRIQVRITKGITPDGEEFSLNGWIRGSDGMDGLQGKIVNDGQLISRSLNETANMAGRAALATMAEDSIALTSVKGGLSHAQGEQSEESERVFGRPEFIVQASEQLAMLEIERTF